MGRVFIAGAPSRSLTPRPDATTPIQTASVKAEASTAGPPQPYSGVGFHSRSTAAARPTSSAAIQDDRAHQRRRQRGERISWLSTMNSTTISVATTNTTATATATATAEDLPALNPWHRRVLLLGISAEFHAVPHFSRTQRSPRSVGHRTAHNDAAQPSAHHPCTYLFTCVWFRSPTRPLDDPPERKGDSHGDHRRWSRVH